LLSAGIRIEKIELTPIEKKILRLASKIIKRKPLRINELYSVSIDQLTHSKEEISSAIYKMILKKIIIDGAKLTKDNILENTTRNEIYHYIKNNPGTHLREIRRQLKLKPNFAYYHLIRLEKFEFIKKKKIQNKLAYFDSDINPRFYEAIFILRKTPNLKILQFILSKSFVDIKLITKKFKFRRRKVNKILQELIETNLIREIIEKNKITFHVNEEKVKQIFEIIKVKI